MKFKTFIKDKFIQICLILFSLFTIEIFLMIYPIGKFLKIYIPTCILSFYFASIIIEYINKNRYYKKIFKLLYELDDKYFINEITEKPNFVEGEVMNEILEEVNKSMIENVNKYKYSLEDYKEYIEMWIHEIKLPIATSKMIVENNKNEVTKSINEEIDKIENYVEQALFYARSNTVEKDYYIRKTSFSEIVNEVILKNKSFMLEDKVSVNLHDLNLSVNTDSKWIVFILNQIIQNSIKYKKLNENLEIEIYANEGKENAILYLKDNGMGIKQGEVPRVFEKGFTGTNGRIINKKSTGIGLFLCKKLCDKLGILISISSEENIGTEAKLVFPNSSYIDMK